MGIWPSKELVEGEVDGYCDERYEDVKDRGQELGARVEAVLSKLQVYFEDSKFNIW